MDETVSPTVKHHSIICKFTSKIHAYSIVKQKKGADSFRAATYKLICYESSLPSRTMALSMSVGRLEPRHPVRQIKALRRGAKLILVRMYVIASEYDSFFFSACRNRTK